MLKESLTVSALTKYIKLKFDKDRYLKNVPLRGEVAEIACRRGNYYLRLKDEHAILSGVIFAQYTNDSIKEITQGAEVEVIGDISVYEKTGMYQMYIHDIALAGIGDIYQAFERLKRKLAEQGYFDIHHKKTIPEFPKKIALVTAPKSAALQDMLITLQRRYPLATVSVFPTAVQGINAPQEIIQKLKAADNADADVVVLARGGGSYEDLLAFNDEGVALQVFEMKTPIVTGVGHEIDITIVDLIGDLRAATPTAAIELITPNKLDLLATLQIQRQKLVKNFQQYLQRAQKEIDFKRSRLMSKSPENLLKHEKLQLQQVQTRLYAQYLYQQVFTKRQQQVIRSQEKLAEMMGLYLKNQEEQVNKSQGVLAALSPFSVLLRGYSITQHNEEVVTGVDQVQQDDTLEILVTDGVITTKVIHTKKQKFD